MRWFALASLALVALAALGTIISGLVAAYSFGRYGLASVQQRANSSPRNAWRACLALAGFALLGLFVASLSVIAGLWQI